MKRIPCKNPNRSWLNKRFLPALISYVLILFLTQPDARSNPPVAGEALPGLEGFDTVMLKLINKYDIPGASLSVSFNGRLILARGYGYAQRSIVDRTPVEPRNQFRFASLSKPLTAAGIMLLVEEGKLSLDAKMVSLLEKIGIQEVKDSRANQITVRHLLEHRAGFDRGISGDPMFLQPPSCPGNLKSFLNQRLDFNPGKKYAYSNIGYCILGRVIEIVSGKPYGDFIREQILEPVGARSVELGNSLKSKANEVSYYEVSPFKNGKGELPYGGFNLEAMDSHGGWIGNSTDYLRFLTSIDGQRPPSLLQANTFKEMLAPPVDPTLKDKATYYAKGFEVRKVRGGGINFWHTGSLPGTLTIGVRTSIGYGWVALFNARPDDWGKVILDIDRTIWEGQRSVKPVPEGDLFDRY